jgi:hypothetical protein
MMTDRERIFTAIARERDYQDKKWGTEFDDKNTVNDWAAYIDEQLMKASQPGKPFNGVTFRTHMLKAAAVCVAALETFDRNKKIAPRHYDTA